jgi:four helix bundle protein
MKLKSYTELIVWQKAMVLVAAVYSATNFPKEEIYGLTSQVRRAAVSIPSNIAEGQGRLSRGESRHFLGNARGSLFEVQTQIHLAQTLKYIDSKTAATIVESADEVGRILNGLLQSLEVEN